MSTGVSWFDLRTGMIAMATRRYQRCMSCYHMRSSVFSSTMERPDGWLVRLLVSRFFSLHIPQMRKLRIWSAFGIWIAILSGFETTLFWALLGVCSCSRKPTSVLQTMNLTDIRIRTQTYRNAFLWDFMVMGQRPKESCRGLMINDFFWYMSTILGLIAPPQESKNMRCSRFNSLSANRQPPWTTESCGQAASKHINPKAIQWPLLWRPKDMCDQCRLQQVWGTSMCAGSYGLVFQRYECLVIAQTNFLL